MVESEFDTFAVDAPVDLARVVAIMANDPLTQTYLGSVRELHGVEGD